MRIPLPILSRICVCLALSCSSTVQAQAALRPWDQGANGLGLQLRRLPVAGRVLLVTAHPDDEHNGVLVALSRVRGLRVGLLTLTRGDGGQNAIGPELFEALGVLRTGELEALHRYDAVEQYFSRAYEFGFSLSVGETLGRWGQVETLGDVVRVVRLFRPDVMLTLPLEGRGEHTHHLASARLAREAFRAAADPARYPEQLAAGLLPWQARKLYQGGVGGGAPEAGNKGAQPVRVDTGSYDPLLGLSSQELGSIERASHRSQSANQLKAEPNQGEGLFTLVDSEPAVSGSERDLLDGLDPSLSGLARFAPAPGRDGLFSALRACEQAALSALQRFDAQRPETVLGALREGLAQLRAARRVVEGAAGWPAEARAELLPRLAEQEQLLAEALRRAHGLTLVATPSDDLAVPGQRLSVTAAVYNAGREAIVVGGLQLDAPEGWHSEPRVALQPGPLAPGATLKVVFDLQVAEMARPSQPYWRRNPARDRYDLDVPEDEGRPWSPPPVTATLRYRTDSISATTSTPVSYRYEGRVVGGERQKELAVVPALSVRVSPSIGVLPIASPGTRREFRATVVNNTPGPAQARLRLEAPPGWTVEPREVTLSFSAEGQEQVTRVSLQAPAVPTVGEGRLDAIASLDGREYREGDQLIAYDHVQERRLYRPSSATLLALDVRVGPGIVVGFVPGLGDELPEALRQLGLDVGVLDADELASGSLERFSTIVLGVRAYADPRVRAQHARLMHFAEQGGHLVLQYARAELNQAGPVSRSSIRSAPAGQKPADSPFAPYPASVTTARITDETASMRLLAPEHPLLSQPNRIGPDDFANWVQERAIQLLDARDARYTQLLASEDPFPENAGEKRGLLVDAQVGQGTWTYVGLVLFRQLPAGTPGAYRLLANLVSRPRGR